MPHIPTLAEQLAHWTANHLNYDTPIIGLSLHRAEAPTAPTSYTLLPAICLIGQGAKRVMLGEEMYVYDAQHFLVSSVDLPVVTQIFEASADQPYLGLTLQLDLQVCSQLMADNSLPPVPPQVLRGMAVSELSSPLQNAIQRLLDLLDTPDDIPIIAPLIQREICYRLLVGEQGARLRQIVLAGSNDHQITRAIDWLKHNFNQTCQVADLAALANMSSSAFHQHFRSLTAMTPIQFQKRLRLNEARRLMLTENFDAANAAFRVGYESPSQFSREYNRLFGAPPLRDIKKLRT